MIIIGRWRKPKVTLMQKIHRWLPFLLFCFAFLFTLLNLLSYTALIGDDAAWHIADSLQTLERSPLRGGYPILFRGLLATFLRLTGTQELSDILLIIKILASALAAFGVLATYTYVNNAFGFPTAILSAFLIAISQKNMQMLGWGGLPNFTSLVLFPLVLYLVCLISEGRPSSEKRSLYIIFLLSLLSSLLFHYWSGAILLSIIALHYFLTLKRKGKIFVSAISLAAILFSLNFGPISATIKSALNRTIMSCTQREALIHLGILWNEIQGSLSLGTTYSLFIPIISGVGLALVIYRVHESEQRKRSSLVLLSWLAVPLMLLFSITYGSYRERFLYFLTYPAYILISIASTSILRYILRAIKLLALLFNPSIRVINTRIFSLALAFLLGFLLISQGYGSMNVIGDNLQLFYPESSRAIIDSINWAQESTPKNSTIISTTWGGPPWKKGPSRWMLLSERNATRSFPILSDLAMEVDTDDLRIYEGIYNQYENPEIEFFVVNPFDKEAYQLMISFIDARSMLTYNNETEVRIPLSGFQGRSIQTLNETIGEVWVLSCSTYEQFMLTRSLNIRNDSSIIELCYNITANQKLEDAYLIINSLLPNVTFSKVLLPGVLEWGSPWDNPTDSSVKGGWASITSTSDNMTEPLVAYTNSIDNILAALRFYEGFSITINSTKGGGIHESTLIFPLGTIPENQTRTIRVELGFFNLRSTWSQITTEEIKQLFEALKEGGTIEVRGLQDTVEQLSSQGPVYVMSEDEYLSPNFPDCILFDRIYANDYVVAYLSKT